MRAVDVMTSEVISVDENASVAAVAKLLAGRGISGVPVVDSANRVIGMVSEGDLLHRAETGTERRRSWWLEMMASTNALAGEYVKAHGRTVKDVMTRAVISVTEATPIADIALLLETKGIKRVPIVRDGKLVGIVSRANLIQALATTIDEPASGADDDHAIREKLLAELKSTEVGRGLARQHYRQGSGRSSLEFVYLGTREASIACRRRKHPGSSARRGPHEAGPSLPAGLVLLLQ